MQYWQMVGKRVVHPEFGPGKCTSTDDGNIVVKFDAPHPLHGDVGISLQHTSVQLERPTTLAVDLATPSNPSDLAETPNH